ncbi:hypothetical protein [Haloferax larsenii]|uniref:Uncharacterized protein n=1 Tax=Haloferax larsenii TaxID=302484 RepID=A0A1H7T949_HALLR|nr:hypothetical protein [Haloferax larsenii]SEL80357.1 hypothetical protein SAMN04488691_10890 [Haloferax larsenii]
MVEREQTGQELKRRDILRKTAITGAVGGTAMSTLFGTVQAEEATQDDIEKIRNAPGVERILTEIGVESLPDTDAIEKRRIKGDGEVTDGELVLMKVNMQDGMLHAFERGSEVRAVFTFDMDLSTAPEAYPIVAETGGSIGAGESELEFTRNATDEEEELILSQVDTQGEIAGGQVHANTAINGFQATLSVKDPETGEAETQYYTVKVGEEFDPRRHKLPGSGSSSSTGRSRARSASDFEITSSNLSSQRVTTQGLTSAATKVVKDILKDWITGKLADEPLEALGTECDDTCSSCVTYIIDLFTTCRWCVSFCSAAASGGGAIICVVCFYAFCNDSVKQLNCAACFVCLVEGEEPDLPGSSAGAALDWVWDELPKFPSPPSVSDIGGEIWD